MIQISDSAQAHFRKLIEREATPGIGVRLAAVQPGTPRADVRLEFAAPDELQGDEWAIDCEGFTLWLDAPSAPFLDGARIDYEARVRELLAQLPGWELAEEGRALVRTFRFDDYHRTMAFVNALAWIAHREDHHPDLGVHYDRCVVRWSTHDVGGLSENDFICAAKASALTE